MSCLPPGGLLASCGSLSPSQALALHSGGAALGGAQAPPSAQDAGPLDPGPKAASLCGHPLCLLVSIGVSWCGRASPASPGVSAEPRVVCRHGGGSLLQQDCRPGEVFPVQGHAVKSGDSVGSRAHTAGVLQASGGRRPRALRMCCTGPAAPPQRVAEAARPAPVSTGAVQGNLGPSAEPKRW